MRLLFLAAVLLTLECPTVSAQIAAGMDSPQCYEGVGCPHKDAISEAQAGTLSCDNLWLVRNTIFHQRGYCFQSVRGQKEFSNARCTTRTVSELALSEVEKRNVTTLERVERRKGCTQ